jgi:hypothetical protein
MAGQRVVAELGRPETPDETAARKAESSRVYRSSQTFRNLIAALIATLLVVLVVVFGVPRGEVPARESIDTAPVAADVAETYDRVVIDPAVPDEWRVNSAAVAAEADGTTAWTIVYVPDDSSFVRFSQAFDADEAWARSELRGTAPSDTATIAGIVWQVFEPADADAAGNISYALGTQAGPDYVLVSGSGSADTVGEVAEIIAPRVTELRSATP